MYVMMFLPAFVAVTLHEHEDADTLYHVIALIVLIVGAIYCFSLSILETPKRYKKRK